jgi:hypothetical protein
MKLKSKITVSIFLLFAIFTSSPFLVEAKIQDTLGALKQSAPEDIKENSDVSSLAGDVIGVGLSLVGVVFFILVVYGGVIYMTSRGNEEQAARGRNTIITASIGVILVLASYALVNFLFSAIGA